MKTVQMSGDKQSIAEEVERKELKCLGYLVKMNEERKMEHVHETRMEM